MKLSDGSNHLSKLNRCLGLFSFRQLGVSGATLFSILGLGTVKTFAQPPFTQPPAPASPDLVSPLLPKLLDVLAQLEGVRFNPPPLRAEDAMISAVSATEPIEAGQACDGLGEVLLPRQGGGLTHQDLTALHLKVPESGELSRPLAEPPSLMLTIASPTTTTAAIALTPAAEQLPGYLSLIPDEPYVLETNATYRWTLVMPCESARSISFSGWIRKVALPQDAENIASATEIQQAQFYSHYGLWYDAVDIAMDLAQSGERSPLQVLQGDR